MSPRRKKAARPGEHHDGDKLFTVVDGRRAMTPMLLVPFINYGELVPVVEISTGLSLIVILGVLVVTVVASLVSRKGKAQTAIANARRHATAYLDSEYTADPAERERIFRLLLDERDQIIRLGPQYRQMVRDEPVLMELLERDRQSHDAAVAAGDAPRRT